MVLEPPKIDELHRLAYRAERCPVSLATLADQLETASGRNRHNARMTAQTVLIRQIWTFMATFSIETDHPRSGRCRRLVISVDRPGRTPDPDVIWPVAKELGFRGGLHLCAAWPETVEGHGLAINVMQPIWDDENELQEAG